MEYDTPVQWTSGDSITHVNNLGLMPSYPIITLAGTFHSPTILNQTNGKFITIETDTVANDKVVIDMKNRIITKNGGSIASYRTIDSTWWALEPGDNKILLQTDSSTDTDFATIRFRYGYGGI